MQPNQILTLQIVDQGLGGEGIAKVEDKVVFVPNTLVGETVEAKVLHIKHNLVYTLLRRVLVPSPHRVSPACPLFGACGGCDWMHADYAYQLAAKQRQVQVTLAKAKVDVAVDPCVPCDTPLGYRNKIMLPFGVVDGRVEVGFYRKNTHNVVPTTHCPLHGDWADKLIAITLRFVRRYRLRVYDSATGKGLLRHLVARYVADHLAVTLVATADVPHCEDYARALAAEFASYALYVSINTMGNNVIMGETATRKAGKDVPLLLDGVSLRLNPLSFLQVNDGIREALYAHVARLVDARQGGIVVDAFAGVGLIGATLARQGTTVYNIEIVPQAVRDAERLAKANGLAYVHNLLGDSAQQLPALLEYLAQSAPNVHTMRLQAPYWQAIAEGKKKYELRQNDAKRKAVVEGDLIAFVRQETPENGGNCAPNTPRVLFARVVEKRAFATFDDLFAALGTQDTCARSMSPQQAAASMQDIYLTAHPDGVVALGVQPVAVRGLSVVLDPPRKGCPEAVVQSLVAMAERQPLDALVQDAVLPDGPVVTLPFVQNIVYISCNPATLARDLALLQAAYRVQSATPYDMFPNTGHIETLISLRRRFDN